MPVNADVPSLDAIMIEEHDPHVNALGIKGVGEIGITGTAGAVANAVWHATGIRVRRFRSRSTGFSRSGRISADRDGDSAAQLSKGLPRRRGCPIGRARAPC